MTLRGKKRPRYSAGIAGREIAGRETLSTILILRAGVFFKDAIAAGCAGRKRFLRRKGLLSLTILREANNGDDL